LINEKVCAVVLPTPEVPPGIAMSRADALAKAAVQIPDPGGTSTSLIYIYRQIKADHNARWKEAWEKLAVDLKPIGKFTRFTSSRHCV
jgi:hypothetical protein